MIKSKSYHRPFYKKLIRLRKHITMRAKVLKFKKQKWRQFQFFAKRENRFFRRYKIKDPIKLSVNRFAGKGNSLKKKFKSDQLLYNCIKTFYGGGRKKVFKRELLGLNLKKRRRGEGRVDTVTRDIITSMESRLDVLLFRAKFGHSMKNSKQLINHGHIQVNNEVERTHTRKLRFGDKVAVTMSKKSRLLVRKNVFYSTFWPIPPKHIVINYKTLSFVALLKSNTKLSDFFFPYKLDVSNLRNVIKFK